ncbi:ATP-grasp peptide maturase system methyltransferase [Streptomyces sp. NPDC058812]|uniref:ATP-grasp peptide maturase system methyltransferase n=1 Tax=unclassified Streptomyces TaxID=2593676 RepID=UPI0036B83AC3
MTVLDSATLRGYLADRLTESGALRTEQWRAAVEAVPRHEFLRGGFFRRFGSAWRPVPADREGWLELCYTDESLVTQIAGTIVPGDVRGEVLREPTSSSTLPSLVVRMLEDLQAQDGLRVLEVGTGTGYSTGLLCHRLGDELVTSVEVDASVSSRAGVGLGACGYFPDLIVGDGLAGHKDGAPYDRVIATCGVWELPHSWIEQTKPGGIILATLCGWMHSSELARLTVGHDGVAHGRFLGGQVQFMLARPQMPPPLGMLPDLNSGEERQARVGADVLDHWDARFVAQLAAPRAQRLSLTLEDSTWHVLVDVEASAWAALALDGKQWTVRQGGPMLLWDAVEDRLQRWQADGAPALDHFQINVTPEGQQITWPTA